MYSHFIRWVGVLVVSLSCAPIAKADTKRSVHYGLGLGINYSRDVFDSSFGFSGSASVTLFQENWIGLRLAADYAPLSFDNGFSSYSANALGTAAVLCFNFNLGNNRHSIGFGAADVFFLNQTYSGPSSELLKTSAEGLVIDGKDMWAMDGGKYFFLNVRVYFPASSKSFANSILIGTLGVDF